jgi:hypothetical protein
VANISSYPIERHNRDRSRGLSRDYLPRVHQLRVTPTALNADFTAQSSVDPAEPFLCTRITGFAFDTATDLMVLPNALLTLRIGGAGGRSMSRDPIHWLNFLGPSTRPRWLPCPLFLRDTTLFLTVQLLTGPLTLALGVKLHGWTVRRFTI